MQNPKSTNHRPGSTEELKEPQTAARDVKSSALMDKTEKTPSVVDKATKQPKAFH